MKLIGLTRIGNDPELRYTSSNMAVLQLSLAYNWGGKEKKTQWVRATLFGKRAESLAPHLGKGQLIYVEVNDLHVNQFTKKTGETAVALEGVIQELEFTGKAEASQQPAQQATQSKLPEQTSLADMQDDIPF